ncbi:MAG: chemotaxis protein CheW [Archangiaceae bacterium]|nr:chemotaxis protein CheW [Archangiaceae bacterium]
MSSETRQVCTFTVAGLRLGVDVTQVQEVLRHQEMTPVPLAPSVVTGLINLRGQIVTALDLRGRLQLPPRPSGELPSNVVVRHGDAMVSLLVDDIGDVLEVDASTFEPPPATLTGSTRALISGVYKLSPHLLMLLNTDLVLRLEAQNPA